MRNSHIAMLGALGAIVLVVVVVIGGIRIAMFDASAQPDDGDSGRRANADMTTISRDLTGFTAIEIRSSWSVELERGDRFDVSLSVPEGEEDNLDVYVDDGRLVLDTERDTHRGWNWFGRNETYEARITMPALEAVRVSSAGHVEIEDFTGDELNVFINGAANVEGRDSSFRQLNLTITGAGNVEFTDVPVENAQVMLSGASNVQLNMDGGELSGTLSGFGNVNYRGTVSSENVRVSGFGNVSPE